MAALQQEFDAAYRAIGATRGAGFTIAGKLEMYALGKLIEGAPRLPARPQGLFAAEQKAKWDARDRMPAMTRDDAMALYVKRARERGY